MRTKNEHALHQIVLEKLLMHSKYDHERNYPIPVGRDVFGKTSNVFADFVICEQGKPVAIIEIKDGDDSHTIMHAVGQLSFYAHRLGLPISACILCTPMSEWWSDDVRQWVRSLGIIDCLPNHILEIIPLVLGYSPSSRHLIPHSCA
jgi:hypothetical protein